MNKNFIQEYITLSKDFRETKSPESIDKLYLFLDELRLQENDKQVTLVLSQVYSLLAFHKSAYEAFVKIADKNNPKDTKKLFTMSELATSHGDNFIIKNKLKKPVLPKTERLILSDFELKTECENFTSFETTNKLIIFGKLFDNEPLRLCLSKGIELENHIEKIADYVQWLGNCKKILIDFYNNNNFEDEADDDWYNSLEIIGVLLDVNAKGKFFATLNCGDDFWSDHILDIEIDDKKVVSMGYDG
jgi:hypothetical protein